MRRKDQVSLQSVKSKSDHSRGLDFGWRTHAAITDWTAKVDTKASIVLSLGTVTLGFCISLSMSDRILDNLTGWQLVFERLGLGLLGAGLLLAASVVIPRLKARAARRTWRDNFIYFGHLRHWNPRKLERHLMNLDEEREVKVLADQLVVMSKIAWWKHVRLQWSIIVITLGLAAVGVAAFGHG